MSALFVLTFSNYSQLANVTDVNIEVTFYLARLLL
jgi:hypothetical protein